MPGTFRLLTNRQGVRLREFHTNLWLFSARKIYLDVGLWFDFEQDSFFCDDSPFTFTFHTPFAIGGPIVNLHDRMCDYEISRLLHNEDIDLDLVENTTPIYCVKFTTDPERGRFLLLNSELVENENNSINIKLKRNGLSKDTLSRRRFLQKDKDEIGVYIRFRYKVLISKKSNLDINKNGFHKKVLVDLRVNDIRTGESDPKVDKTVEVGKFMFFIILPSSFEVLMGVTQAYRYVRMLEPEWRNYIKYPSSKQLLVYYWKQKELGRDSFNLVVGARQERDINTWLLLALLFVAVVTVIVYTEDKFNLAVLGGGGVVQLIQEVAQLIQKVWHWLTLLIVSIVLFLGGVVWVAHAIIWGFLVNRYNAVVRFLSNRRGLRR